MKKIIAFIFLICTCCNHIFSQEINGKIINKDGEALPYAAVYLKYLKSGTTSDENGNFIIKTPETKSRPVVDTLIVSYIGYARYSQVVLLSQKNTTINITLQNANIGLKEVVIRSLPYYLPEKIIKLAIKNTKKNYIRDDVWCNGFYRELVSEDNRWIELNEAAIQLKYAQYPQKNFDNQAFRAWYKYDDQPWNIFPATLFFSMHRYNSRIPINKDQIKIVSSRVTNNLSDYETQASPVGSAAGLVSLDKIKYQCDFFDSKLVEKYNYKLFGEGYYEDELCYIIDFYPKNKYDEDVYQALNRKIQFPIYVGRIYIRGESFAVVNIQYQLSPNVNFRYYSNYEFPDFMKVEIKYKKNNGDWMLHAIETEQRKFKTIGSKKVAYTCLRNLLLEKPNAQKIEFNEDSIQYITKSAQLRYFNNRYDPSFWRQYELTSSYPKLAKSILADLEKKTPLEKQFLNLNLPVDSIHHPKAKLVPFQYIYATDTLQDNYNWLRTEALDTIIDFAKKENNYQSEVLFKIKEKKSFYYAYNNTLLPDTTTSNGKNYSIKNGVSFRFYQNEMGDTCMFKLLKDSTEKEILNYTNLKKNKENFYFENLQFNRSEQLAYLYSTKGEISYTLEVQDDNDKKKTEIADVFKFYWLNDSTIIYTKTNAARRAYQLKILNINTNTDSLLLQENNSKYDITLSKSNSGKYIFVAIGNEYENKTYSLNAQEKQIELNLINEKMDNSSFLIDHFDGENFYAIKNNNQDDYSLLKIPINRIDHSEWETLYTSKNPIDDFYINKKYIAMAEFNVTKLQLKYLEKSTGKIADIQFDEEIGSFDFDKKNGDSSNVINVVYNSPKTPYTKYEINLETGIKTILEQDKFILNKTFRTLAGIYPLYKMEILYANSNELKIPITLYYDESWSKDSIKGIILKAYGAYGSRHYPEFSAEDKVYVDDGYVIATAHVRGGAERGAEWYNQGKLLNKINTFEDYVACAKYLTEIYHLRPNQLIGYGQSAGGLIMGYVANNYPNLFGTLIFDRPYLDVLNTMMDSTIALTTMEYSEWGNPNDSAYYNYIKSYSPYQNIKAQNYPNMLFFAGSDDEQTLYWQIAKSVAKYRANNTSNSLILLNTNIGAGHRGSTNTSQNMSKLGAKFTFINYCIKK